MRKTQKELAFLRDLNVSLDWTERFTNLVDKNVKFPKEGKLLYFNAGTGSYALALREKLNRDVELVCVCEDAETRKIAEAKAKAVKSKIDFRNFDELKSEDFDFVLADLSLTDSEKINETLDELAYLTEQGGKIAFFAPTAGSFGEVFSYLWETFLSVDLIEKSGEIERLISDAPTVSKLEEAAKDAGLTDIDTETGIEIFEYETADEFVSSTLVADFLFPAWLDFLTEPERKKAIKQLSKIIDNDLEGLSFRLSVKATLVEGEKS